MKKTTRANETAPCVFWKGGLHGLPDGSEKATNFRFSFAFPQLVRL
jgi:hypothetical protein